MLENVALFLTSYKLNIVISKARLKIREDSGLLLVILVFDVEEMSWWYESTGVNLFGSDAEELCIELLQLLQLAVPFR